MNGPSIFIAKTFEILEVASVLFRTTPTRISWFGMSKVRTLPSWTLIVSNRRYCLYTLGIEIFHLS